MPTLLDEFRLGAIRLPNRIVISPSAQRGLAAAPRPAGWRNPNRYLERGSAGLIITEPSPISSQARGEAFAPGIIARAEIDDWRRVTSSARAAGASIVLRLGHAGRLSHPRLLDGHRPVAPSATRSGLYLPSLRDDAGDLLRCPVPRALKTDEVALVIADYRRAAENAVEAGFDGVEIDASGGFLIDQFLRRSTNRRDDRYGGSAENRIRFLLEATGAVAAVVGAGRTGVRLSPFISDRGMRDEEIAPTVLAAAAALDRMGIAFLHLVEPATSRRAGAPEFFRRSLRTAFRGRILAAGGYDHHRAQGVLWDGHADAVSFEQPFVLDPVVVPIFEPRSGPGASMAARAIDARPRELRRVR